MDTDPILAALAERRAEHLAAGRLPEVQRVDAQTIAVQTLARLAVERQAAVERGDADAVAGVDAQAAVWVRRVDVDVLTALVDRDQVPDGGPVAGDATGRPAPTARQGKSKA